MAKERQSSNARDARKGPSLEERRQTFDQTYEEFFAGEVTFGDREPRKLVRCYEMIIDPTDIRERQILVHRFILKAREAGYSQAMAPVVLPGVGFRDRNGQVPLSSVSFFLERQVPRPVEQPSGVIITTRAIIGDPTP